MLAWTWKIQILVQIGKSRLEENSSTTCPSSAPFKPFPSVEANNKSLTKLPSRTRKSKNIYILKRPICFQFGQTYLVGKVQVTCTIKVRLILVEDFVVYDRPTPDPDSDRDPDRKSIWPAASAASRRFFVSIFLST